MLAQIYTVIIVRAGPGGLSAAARVHANKEGGMLQMQYIGLLNTDKHRKGPVQMFIQGRGSQERYVLDRLPRWIEAWFSDTPETSADVCDVSGANLSLLSREAREAVHKQLVEDEYKVRRINGGYAYLSVGEVFYP